MIVDAEYVASVSGVVIADPREYLLAFYPESVIATLDQTDPEAEPLTARVNNGTWIVSCDCGTEGAGITPGMAVWLSVPWAWCLLCSNASTGGRWRPVVVPSPDERAAIEAVLDCRPRLGERNWDGETVAELAEQNRAHGDVVPQSGAIFAPRERGVPEEGS